MGTQTLAVLVVVVVIVGGLIGIYLPKSGQSASTSSPSAVSSESSAPSTSSNTTSSTVSSTTASNTTASSTIPPPTMPLFNFTLVTAPSTILIAPGAVLNYSSVLLVPAPNKLEGNALLNAGIGSELVVLNAVVPGGMRIQFFGSTHINRIYEEAGAGQVMSTEMQLVAPPNTAPGNYTVEIDGSSGALTVKYTFTVQVVKYLIIAQYYRFSPNNLTVPVGSTVYWINISTDKNQPYDVIFTTIKVTSPTLNPGPAYDSFSHTFTTAGVYPYYCAYLAAMKGTIVVTG